MASRMVALSLTCADQEYPNKSDSVFGSDKDMRPAREKTPAFFGCFDWHSAVHGHWSMVRLAKLFPDLPEQAAVRRLLDAHLTADRMTRELAHFESEHNKSFERPYGWAWYLRLVAELHTWKDGDAARWEQALQPLAQLLSKRLRDYLGRLSAPIRAGTHANSAYALAHALDYARAVGDTELASAIVQRSRDFYARDQACPTAYEPSGEDFISPCLAEADLMRRVLEPGAFPAWLTSFLPPLGAPAFAPLLAPIEVRDRKDPRIGHLIGLSLQRSSTYQGIAAALPVHDGRADAYRRLSRLHLKVALEQMFDSGYGGAHWLASFAIHSMTNVGVVPGEPK